MEGKHPAKTDTIAKADRNLIAEETTLTHARELVEQCGTPELAAEAIEKVSQNEQAPQDAAIGEPGVEHHNFAVALGFDSFAALKQNSTVVPSNDGQEWFLTKFDDSAWCAWTGNQLNERRYCTREEALATVPREDVLTGSALLG
jgi:hypothetical protein